MLLYYITNHNFFLFFFWTHGRALLSPYIMLSRDITFYKAHLHTQAHLSTFAGTKPFIKAKCSQLGINDGSHKTFVSALQVSLQK